jgi:hypothetical protein
MTFLGRMLVGFTGFALMAAPFGAEIVLTLQVRDPRREARERGPLAAKAAVIAARGLRRGPTPRRRSAVPLR